MVRTCCVKNCRNCWIPNTNLTFHTFPWSNKECLEEWMSVVLSKNRIGKYSLVCSVHFNDSDFSQSEKNRILKKTAVLHYFEGNELSKITPICIEDQQNTFTASSLISINSPTSENLQTCSPILLL